MVRPLLLVAILAAVGRADDTPPKPVADTVTKLMAEHKVPGVAVAIVADYRLVWAGGFGVRETGGEPVDRDTLFQMASVSKPVAGIAAAALVDAGKLDLDADVNTLLKSWKLPAADAAKGEKVTLRRLLGHRAGTTVHGFPGYAAGKPVPALTDLLDGKPPANTAAIRVNKQPGSGVRYSGGGYCVAQLALSEHTGEPFPTLMKEQVFDKLGLTRCTYEQPLPDRFRANAASGHNRAGKPIPGKYHTYPEMAAAGLWATAPDVAAVFTDLAAAWAGRPAKTLSQKAARDLFATGVGWPQQFAGEEFVAAHGGSNEGFRCLVAVKPKTGHVAVVLTNSDTGDRLLTPVVNAIRKHHGW